MLKKNSAVKAKHAERAADGQPSGLDVGRLILRDLAKAYENMGQGLLTDQERLELVENLRGPEEIYQFNQFRYLHEYLTRANLAASVHRQTASACFWQIKYCLELLRKQPALSDPLSSLRLLTQKQYKNQRKKKCPLFQEDGGVPQAVLVPEAEELLATYIDERGYFKADDPLTRPEKAARGVEEIKNLPQAIMEYKQAVRETLVIEAAVEIISQFVEVPEIRGLVGWLDLEEFKALNLALRQTAGQPFDLGDSAVESELKAALTPFKLATLTPSESARRKARQAVDFSTVQGHIETFYHLLRS